GEGRDAGVKAAALPLAAEPADLASHSAEDRLQDVVHVGVLQSRPTASAGRRRGVQDRPTASMPGTRGPAPLATGPTRARGGLGCWGCSGVAAAQAAASVVTSAEDACASRTSAIVPVFRMKRERRRGAKRTSGWGRRSGVNK